MLKRKSHAVFKTAAVTENVANKSGLVNFTAVEKLYYVYYIYIVLAYIVTTAQNMNIFCMKL